MPPSDTPLNKAHQHASNAEDYLNQGLLIPAAEEHYKSAEAFLQCVEQSSDDGTKRTLRMLYNEHSKSGKELQRKIAKLKEEGKDPSLPQVTTPPPRERPYTFSPTVTSLVSSSRYNPRAHMSDSNHTIDESYMVLGQQSDPADTFHHFWKTLEGMLDNISQPVAFATAPLLRSDTIQSNRGVSSAHSKRNVRQEGSSSGEDDFRVKLAPKSSDRTPGIGPSGRKRNSYTSNTLSRPSNALHEAMEATIVLNSKEVPNSSDPEEVMADEDSPSGESFFLIPSATSPSLTAKLQKENALLKHELASVQQQLQTAEQMRVEQEQQIRDRILSARREAQRVMTSSYLPQRQTQPPIDLSVLNLNATPLPAYPGPMPGGRDREAQLVCKIKELEEEVQIVRVDNEKQRATIVKFRERWEKLKESAKRKRSAKVNAGPDNNVREQRIEEEPDAEVEADDRGPPQ